MNYYAQKLFLPQVDKNDNIIGRVERWQAHKKEILHRGFTTILIYNNQFVLQQRKHPAFDGFFDLSFSSHPVFIGNKLQSMEDAIYQTLKREWNLQKTTLKTDLKFVDKFYYKARDPNSAYTEYEIDYIYLAEIKKPPRPNPAFAYGYKLVDKKKLEIRNLKLEIKFAPWVKKIIENKFFQERQSLSKTSPCQSSRLEHECCHPVR